MKITIAPFNPTAFVKELKVALMGIVAFGALVMVAHGCSGCKPTISADDAYTAELLACSSAAHTKAEATACREGVNRKYNLCDNPAAWPRIQPCPKGTQ